jgi:hypothetical protein
VRRISWIAVSPLLAGIAPLAMHAQGSVESNVVVSSASVWRGVTSTNRAIIQPDVTLDVPFRGGVLSVGAWTSIEPARYDDASDISAVYGLLPGPAVTQYSAWLTHITSVASIGVITGVSAYLYPAVADLASLYNTIELSAAASFPLPLAPSIAVWCDVGAVRGAYLEGSISAEQQVLRLPVHLAFTGGLNAGQGPEEGRQAYFVTTGLSHVEFSATTVHQLGSVSIAPSVHVIRGFDPLAQVVSPTASRGVKLWIGTTLSWTSAVEASR